MNRNKYFIAGAALLVGVLVVYFAVSGFPPTGEVAGTMAGGDSTIAGVEQAERYRADAISDDDVELDDQTVNNLLQDPDVVAVLHDQDFQNALTSGSLTDALAAPQFENLLRDGILRHALAEYPRFKTALMENNLAAYFAQENELRKLPDFDKLRVAFTDKRMEAALGSNSLRNFLTRAPVSKLDNALARSLAVSDFRTAMNSGVLKNALRDADFLRALDDQWAIHSGTGI